MLAALEARRSFMLIAEAGSGKSTLIARVLESVTGYDKITIASYNGSVKQSLLSIAEQLGIAVNTNKPINSDALKEEIIEGADRNTLIVCDNAHRWAASLRYWLEILNAKGVVLILVAIEDLKKDIFVGLMKIELGKLGEAEIRELMTRSAIAEGYSLSPGNLAYLQSLAGSNPMLAKKLIAEAKMGRHLDGDHNQYINVAPFVNGILAGLGIIRFVGLGLDNLSLYIFGGIAMLLAISVRYIGIGLNQSQRRKPLGKK
ncbi:MAG: hypothetical protein N5P05_004193 (plasmid) [Chroococcopsis gigantea SAG 12.99]|jgi:hypothetical protein|nr:hypothetical protein [Chroococcopsis gigantea SAG 12.99]